MGSTAIYSNRIYDKRRLEATIGLPEFGGPQVFRTLGGAMFATAFVRVVYGDHGAYVEFARDHVVAPLVGRFGDSATALPPPTVPHYYVWLEVPGAPGLKVYWQIKPVTDKPNAPARDDGRPSCFNRRKGYADYRRGMMYVDPYALVAEGVRPRGDVPGQLTLAL